MREGLGPNPCAAPNLAPEMPRLRDPTLRAAKGAPSRATAAAAAAFKAARCLKVVRRSSKKAKKTALLMPLLSARGPIPRKNALGPPYAHALTLRPGSVWTPSHAQGRKLLCYIIREIKPPLINIRALYEQISVSQQAPFRQTPSPPFDRYTARMRASQRRTDVQTAAAALDMVGRAAALHIMRVLMTSNGVVAAAAKAPEIAPMQKSSCNSAGNGQLTSHVIAGWLAALECIAV